MKLSSTRDLAGLKPVLKDSNSTGPDPVYWVFSDATDSKWANVTMIASGSFNGEFPKTFGHYHGVDVPEIYHLIEGQGILLLQKKHMEGETWIPEKVSEVLLIQAKPGDEILITPEWGHSWSNVGTGPLISFDDWRSGHTPGDYEKIEQLQGLAYYLISENGQVKPVPNPHYVDLPEPKFITAAEFKANYQS